MGDVVVRRYVATDREAVRRICVDTGYMGDPVGWLWADRASFADLFTSWYTDHEPESAFVADHDGRVVGYLLGCRDTRRVGSPARVLRRHLRRGVLLRPGTAGVLWRSVADLVRDRVRGRPLPTGFVDDRWPAHLHIDLLPEARSRGVGALLIDRWIEVLHRHDIRGCHLETWAENDGAVAFFRRMGFSPHGDPVPMPGIRSPEGHRHHTQVMVRTLGPAPGDHGGRAAQHERPAPPTTTGGAGGDAR